MHSISIAWNYVAFNDKNPQELSEKEFDYYNWMPGEVSTDGQACFVKTAEPIILEPNLLAPSQDIEIRTEAYTLKLQAEWEGKYLITEQNGWLSVYEKGSHEAMGAGNLFSITSFSIGEDYHFPSYDYLGTYVHDGEQYEFIMLYATDMQATDATRERYAAMKDTVPWIIDHMEWHWERVDEAEP